MLHQRQKKRQVALGDAPLVERQDEIAAAGVDEKIRILDAFGDALVGQQLADVVTGEERPEVFRRDIGIDRHENLQRDAALARAGCHRQDDLPASQAEKRA